MWQNEKCRYKFELKPHHQSYVIEIKFDIWEFSVYLEIPLNNCSNTRFIDLIDWILGTLIFLVCM